jgi:hypothetical protein
VFECVAIVVPPSLNTISAPSASKIISALESKVISPVELIPTVPSAVIVKFAAAAEASVVTRLVAPLAATVVTKVSPEEPVIVMTLPFTATSSTTRLPIVPVPVVVIAPAPTSILVNPDVIEPESNAPVLVRPV